MEMPESNNLKIIIPKQVKIIQSHFDYSTAWGFLHTKGVELYGTKFKLFQEDADIIIKLIAWFIKDELTAAKMGVDLSKGILLVGPVGCGKTTLMNLCRYLIAAEDRHTMKSCREITFEFIKDGYDVFHRYTKGSFSQHKFQPKTFCFDDLGLENVMNYCGNQCSVMAEILLSRYDLFHSFSMLTHLTTNLTSSEIEELYGIRVRSRMREQFNLIAFDNESIDKRT